MEIYKYLIKNNKFEIDTKYEFCINSETTKNICNHFNLTNDDLQFYITHETDLFNFENGFITLLKQRKYYENEFEIVDTFLDKNVIIMKSNKYINITKFCNRSRQYSHFKQTQRYKDICKLLKDEGVAKVETTVNNISNDYKGSYVHQKIAIAVSSWLSVDFVVKFESIILKCNNLIHINNQITNELNEIKNTLSNLKKSIVPKDDWSVFRLYKVTEKEFYVVRCINKNKNSYKHKYYDKIPIHEIPLPSSIQYYDDFKITYKTIFKFDRNTIRIPDEKKDDDLLYYIIKHHVDSLNLYIESKKD